MANEDEGTQESRTLYVLTGSKQQGEKVRRIIVEGSTENPVRFADLNGAPVALTDDEHKRYSKLYKFRKEGEEQERGPAGASDDTTPDTKEEQQVSQAASAPAGVPVTTTTTRSERKK